jgi:hypothetical protein
VRGYQRNDLQMQICQQAAGVPASSAPSNILPPGTNLDTMPSSAKVVLLKRIHNVTAPTNEGVTLTKDSNGGVIAEIKVTGNALNIGYARKANGITAPGQLYNRFTGSECGFDAKTPGREDDYARVTLRSGYEAIFTDGLIADGVKAGDEGDRRPTPLCRDARPTRHC